MSKEFTPADTARVIRSLRAFMGCHVDDIRNIMTTIVTFNNNELSDAKFQQVGDALNRASIAVAQAREALREAERELSE